MRKSFDVKEIWSPLGTFWPGFEDKELIEVIWNAYRDLIMDEYRTLFTLDLSKGLDYLPPHVEHKMSFFDIVYDVASEEYEDAINTVLISGLYNYYIDEGVFDIPSGLLNYYYLNDDVTSGSGSNEWVLETLVQGVDFEILDYNRIQFTPNPSKSYYPAPFQRTMNDPYIYHTKLFAPTMTGINNVLFDMYGKLVDVNKNHLRDRVYHSFQTNAEPAEQTKLDLYHFKYLIWALFYLRFLKPTIENLKRLYGIAHGAPFAYTSGKISDISESPTEHIVTLNNDVYHIPISLTLGVSLDTPVDMFQLLISGIDVYDYVNNDDEIEDLAEKPWQTHAILEFSIDPSIDTLDYDPTIVSELMEEVLPKSMKTYFTVKGA